MLSGKISKANYFRRIINEDIKKINLGGGNEREFIFLGMGLNFADQVLNRCLNPENNILIKNVKNITDEDIHLIISTLITHFIFRIITEHTSSSSIDLNLIMKRLENDLNFSEDCFRLVLKNETDWSKRLEKDNLNQPMVNLISEIGGISKQNIKNEIVYILEHSYKQTKGKFSTIFQE